MLLIGADLVPTKTNAQLFAAGDAEALVGQELLDILKSADYRVFNLEVPLSDEKSPIEKCGPALVASTDSIVGYKALGMDLLTIANNHIMDQGEQGYFSTVKLLEENGIAYVGGGCDPEQAARPYIAEIKGKKIGIYGCAEHEFSIVREDKPGANPFDPLESPDHVAALKSQCDYVIVLYHGGKEHYRYPSPDLQKVCRKLVQKGADLVICQHSHCIGCEEKYLHGTIVYGQGNFLFDCTENEYWQTSLLIQLADDMNICYIPLCKNGNAVRLAEGEEAKTILDHFRERSQQIAESGFVQKNYETFAQSMQQHYLAILGGKESFLFRAANKLVGGRLRRRRLTKRYERNNRLAIQNVVECEAHRELLLRGIQDSVNKKEV